MVESPPMVKSIRQRRDIVLWPAACIYASSKHYSALYSPIDRAFAPIDSSRRLTPRTIGVNDLLIFMRLINASTDVSAAKSEIQPVGTGGASFKLAMQQIIRLRARKMQNWPTFERTEPEACARLGCSQSFCQRCHSQSHEVPRAAIAAGSVMRSLVSRSSCE